MIGDDGRFILDILRESGVDVSRASVVSTPTGRAFIQVRSDGQNCILLAPGANREIGEPEVDAFLGGWGRGDALLVQNEVSCVPYAIREAGRRGMRVFLNPSPVDARLPGIDAGCVDCLVLNEIEGEYLSGERDPGPALAALRHRFPSADIVLTLGEEGVRYLGRDGVTLALPARRVPVVDTTGAGDTFTGYFIASTLAGAPPREALRMGIEAAAICVGRAGAVPSIPWLRELPDRPARSGADDGFPSS